MPHFDQCIGGRLMVVFYQRLDLLRNQFQVNLSCLPSVGATTAMQSQMFIVVILFTGVLTLQEGEDCTLMNTGQKGKCISVYRCEAAKKLLQANRRPQGCGFNRQTQLVCCTAVPGTKSDERCRNYHIQGLGVANGEQAEPKEFPHMAAIGYLVENKLQWLCGGTLISNEMILTAAHCAAPKDYGAPVTVRLGDLNLNDTKDDATPSDFSVGQIFVHPEYRSSSHYHDIALVKLQGVVRFDSYMSPACLQVSRQVPNVLQAIGWGRTGYFDDPSNHLMKVSLNVVNHASCVQRFLRDKKLQNGILEDIQICAGDSNGKDTCPGDSGGPLHFKRSSENIKSHFVVVGVTSFGRGCGVDDSVGVYARVSSYIGWIEDIVWP